MRFPPHKAPKYTHDIKMSQEEEQRDKRIEKSDNKKKQLIKRLKPKKFLKKVANIVYMSALYTHIDCTMGVWAACGVYNLEAMEHMRADRRNF